MDSEQINKALGQGKLEAPGILPHVDALKEVSYVFRPDFGLSELPPEPGLLVIRGPRQFGKSTWLELQIKETISEFGPGSAFYLNGDELRDREELAQEIESLLPLFREGARVKRLFIDEITAIDSWETTLKRLFDRGLGRDVLVISTGSKAADLRHGTERLPGRKGKLTRTQYLFTPIPFREFERLCGPRLKSQTLAAYLLSGGCPIAGNEIVTHGRIPEYIILMIRDWIFGECFASGRNRSSMLAVLDVLLRYGGSSVGQSRLARESGLANNTVAAGYIELLADLLTVVPCYAWDPSRRRPIKRKPCKFHFVNLLAAVSSHPFHIRSLEDFENLLPEEKAKLWEWLVAQELWRRAAVRGEEDLDQMLFWQSDEHEIDFVVAQDQLLEVKLSASSPIEFSWFPKVFPKARLEVITTTPFETRQIRGIRLEDFLRDAGFEARRAAEISA